MRPRSFPFVVSKKREPRKNCCKIDVIEPQICAGGRQISRGIKGKFAVDPAVAEALHGAIERLRAEKEATIVRADALSFLRAPLLGRFDVVFVDPPFDARLWPQVLASLPPWLSDDAWLYMESPVAEHIAPDGGWTLHREGRTREVRHALYRRVAGVAATLAADSSRAG